MTIRLIKSWSCLVMSAVLVLAAGCAGPFAETNDQALRHQVLNSHKAHLSGAAPGGVRELGRVQGAVELDLTEERRAELNEMSGPTAYKGEHLILGYDLLGRGMDPEKLIERNLMRRRIADVKRKQAKPNHRLSDLEKQMLESYPAKIAEIDAEFRAKTAGSAVHMTLRRAIQLTVQNNLDLALARLIPAITEQQITQAEGVFDATFFVNYNFSKLDTPQPSTVAGLDVFGTVDAQEETLQTGIRKVLTSGGQITASTQFSRISRDPSFFDPITTYREANMAFTIQQPLLRNFGADVTRSQIMLAKNARDQAVQDQRQQLLAAVQQTETVYWSLVLARQQLLIQAKLLERTIRQRDIVRERMDVDATEVDLSEANNFVASRRADFISARQNIRLLSDTLKRLINTPDLPMSGETVILPLDKPADVPVKFNLLDGVTTALKNRPELQASLLSIKDASIRQRVADNQRLPVLDLTATVQYNGVGDDLNDAYDTVREASFIDYLVGLQFEVPLGNRQAEGLFQQRRLEKQAATIEYQRRSQLVVQEVKDALRSLITAYELIGARRDARLAAADNIRALEVREDLGEALNPQFVDLKMRRLGNLALAELQEMQALTDYNASLAEYYRTTATLLQRNGIEFEDTGRDEKR